MANGIVAGGSNNGAAFGITIAVMDTTPVIALNKIAGTGVSGKPGEGVLLYDFQNKKTGAEFQALINGGYIIEVSDLIVTQQWEDHTEDKISVLPSTAEPMLVAYVTPPTDGVRYMYFSYAVATGDSGSVTYAAGAVADAPLQWTSVAADVEYTLLAATIGTAFGITTVTDVVLAAGSHGTRTALA